MVGDMPNGRGSEWGLSDWLIACYDNGDAGSCYLLMASGDECAIMTYAPWRDPSVQEKTCNVYFLEMPMAFIYVIISDSILNEEIFPHDCFVQHANRLSFLTSICEVVQAPSHCSCIPSNRGHPPKVYPKVYPTHLVHYMAIPNPSGTFWKPFVDTHVDEPVYTTRRQQTTKTRPKTRQQIEVYFNNITWGYI